MHASAEQLAQVMSNSSKAGRLAVLNSLLARKVVSSCSRYTNKPVWKQELCVLLERK